MRICSCTVLYFASNILIGLRNQFPQPSIFLHAEAVRINVLPIDLVVLIKLSITTSRFSTILQFERLFGAKFFSQYGDFNARFHVTLKHHEMIAKRVVLLCFQI